MGAGRSPRRRGIRIAVGALLAAGAVAIVAAGARLLPLGLPSGDAYFLPLPERVLLEDERGQWRYVRDQFAKLEATGDTFEDWDPAAQPMWKYAIAFSAYGMPSLALIDPEQADFATYELSVMIRKMKSPKVWLDWPAFGFGDDPITRHNIMYKGHLNLMYGLYQLVSGDERFAQEFTWLTQQIVAEIRQHHEEGLYQGTTCEPDMYFVQCNSVGLLSLLLYDRLYGTDYSREEGRWVLDFIRQRMTDPETGLYWLQYHPSHDVTERYLSGYTNAWAIVMLRALEPEYNERLYPIWKQTFVSELGPFAYVSEVPGGGPEARAILFGLWAAKEYGDRALFAKLRNAVDHGRLKLDGQRNEMLYEGVDNTLGNGPMLAAKLHVGWDVILRHDWGHTAPFVAPSVRGMTWRDVLPQQVHELRLVSEPLASAALPESFCGMAPEFGVPGVATPARAVASN